MGREGRREGTAFSGSQQAACHCHFGTPRCLPRSPRAAWLPCTSPGAHPQPHGWIWGVQKPSPFLPFAFFFYPSRLCASPPARGPLRAAPSIRSSPRSYFGERQEVFLVLPAPRRSSEPLSRSSAGARETAAALADISCIIKLNPSRGPGLGHQLSEEGKEWSQGAGG